MAEEKKLPKKRPTALKRDIRNAKRREINKSFKSRIHTAVRTFNTALEGKDKAAITEGLNQVYSMMDQGVKRGILKANKAARTKARFSKRTTA